MKTGDCRNKENSKVPRGPFHIAYKRIGYLNPRLLALPPSDPHASQDILSFCGAAPHAAGYTLPNEFCCNTLKTGLRSSIAFSHHDTGNTKIVQRLTPHTHAHI
jgi:hypothetical protein